MNARSLAGVGKGCKFLGLANKFRGGDTRWVQGWKLAALSLKPRYIR